MTEEVAEYGQKLRQKNGQSFDQKCRTLRGQILALHQIKLNELAIETWPVSRVRHCIVSAEASRRLTARGCLFEFVRKIQENSTQLHARASRARSAQFCLRRELPRTGRQRGAILYLCGELLT